MRQLPGILVIFGGKPGPAPGSEENGEGIGRARILAGEDALTVIPIDLPMDPGTGKARLSENLVFDSALATWLGFTKATLLKGEYPIDYSRNERYGRAVISAELVK